MLQFLVLIKDTFNRLQFIFYFIFVFYCLAGWSSSALYGHRISITSVVVPSLLNENPLKQGLRH